MTPWGFLSKRDTSHSESDGPTIPVVGVTPPPTDGQKSKQRRSLVPCFALLLVGSLLLLLYLPTFIWLGQSWYYIDYYSHGPLILLVSGLIVWIKRRELKQTRPNDAGAIVLALGASLYIVGFVVDMRYPSAISLIVVLLGLVLSIYGTKVARSMAFAISFLVFTIPMPFIDEITFHLQDISIHWTGWLLKVSGMPIAISGNLIILDDAVMSIGLACSGLNTLMALLAFAALYAYLLAGPSSRRVFLLLCSIPIAILANVLRIASVVLVAHFYDVDFATGFYHDYIASLLAFLLAVLFIALIGKLLALRLAVRISTK